MQVYDPDLWLLDGQNNKSALTGSYHSHHEKDFYENVAIAVTWIRLPWAHILHTACIRPTFTSYLYCNR